MKRSLIVPALFLLLARVEAQQPDFTSNTSLVIIDVNVRDKSGKVISNLTKNDFTLFEDGKAQTISVFDFQKLEGDTLLAPVPAIKPLAERPAGTTTPAPAPKAAAKAPSASTAAPI